MAVKDLAHGREGSGQGGAGLGYHGARFPSASGLLRKAQPPGRHPSSGLPRRSGHVHAQTFSAAVAGEAPCFPESPGKLFKSKGSPALHILGRNPEEQCCLACYISVSVSLVTKQE